MTRVTEKQGCQLKNLNCNEIRIHCIIWLKCSIHWRYSPSIKSLAKMLLGHFVTTIEMTDYSGQKPMEPTSRFAKGWKMKAISESVSFFFENYIVDVQLSAETFEIFNRRSDCFQVISPRKNGTQSGRFVSDVVFVIFGSPTIRVPGIPSEWGINCDWFDHDGSSSVYSCLGFQYIRTISLLLFQVSKSKGA